MTSSPSNASSPSPPTADYDQRFFAGRDARTRHAAERILDIVGEVLPPIASAVDIGCGVGTWLRVLQDRGVADVLGAEGDWLDPSLLQIDTERFMPIDLRRPLEIHRRFDLAINLEVAEHVDAADGSALVTTLCRLADAVLFSAAVPGQGGKHHVNEQWPTYWAARFAAHGFVPCDVVRPQIWGDPDIAVWYRQNILLFVRDSRVPELRGGATPADPAGLSLVHPELYARRLLRAHSLGGGLKSVLRSFVGGGAIRRTLTAAGPPTTVEASRARVQDQRSSIGWGSRSRT